ncbi:MAG: alpha/beta fold hydrolase [Deltaproteobacteria bacterium]|nr:alpha/beta fold hydrolase [Deltaproteobacteria bacterium]
MTNQRFILLHGFAGSPDSWQEVAEVLPSGSALLRLSILGHGKAEDPHGHQHTGSSPGRSLEPASGPFETEVDRLAAQVLAAGFQGSHLVGYSLGGRLALGLLARHPELVASASLIGAHTGLGSQEERRQRMLRDESWADLAETTGLASFLEKWEEQPLFSTQNQEQRSLQNHRRRHLDPMGLGRALRSLSLARMPDYRPRIPTLEMPIRWIAGERDAKFRRLAKEAAQAQRAGTYARVPASGHNVPLEQPRLLAALLAEDLTLEDSPHKDCGPEEHSLRNQKTDTQIVMEGSLR